MPTLENVEGLNDLGPWLVWTLAVQALAFAMFQSFWARELRSWIDRRWADRLRRLTRAAWEAQHRVEFNQRAAKGDPLAAKRPLTDSEVAARRRMLRHDQWRTMPIRVMLYLLGCTWCQAFWAALLLQVASVAVCGRALLWVVTALGYAASAVIFTRLLIGGEARRD